MYVGTYVALGAESLGFVHAQQKVQFWLPSVVIVWITFGSDKRQFALYFVLCDALHLGGFGPKQRYVETVKLVSCG